MNDKHAKYLIIDSKEINKQLYKIKREFAFNDFNNIYIPNGVMTAEQVFEKNGIPQEFRKIIVKLNTPFCLKIEALEYTMGFPFDITAGKIEIENDQKTISVNSSPVYDSYANEVFRDKIKFKTNLVYSNFEYVINFFEQLKQNGYLKQYLLSVKEFFDMSLDLDLLLTSWEESTKNINNKPTHIIRTLKRKNNNKNK